MYSLLRVQLLIYNFFNKSVLNSVSSYCLRHAKSGNMLESKGILSYKTPATHIKLLGCSINRLGRQRYLTLGKNSSRNLDLLYIRFKVCNKTLSETRSLPAQKQLL